MTNQTAYDKYHALYDNDKYRIVTQVIAEELSQEREGNTVSDLANMITDASLGLCGHVSYENACHTLALFCCWHNLSPATIDVIYRYLLVFQQSPDTRADDFEALAKTMYHLQALRSALQTALAHANGLHSWQGRAGYHLLGSAEQLLQGAKALLQGSGASYTQEKLMNGITQISYALNEASQHDSSYNCLLKPQK
jgi:hypothetical protein